MNRARLPSVRAVDVTAGGGAYVVNKSCERGVRRRRGEFLTVGPPDFADVLIGRASFTHKVRSEMGGAVGKVSIARSKPCRFGDIEHRPVSKSSCAVTHAPRTPVVQRPIILPGVQVVPDDGARAGMTCLRAGAFAIPPPRPGGIHLHRVAARVVDRERTGISGQALDRKGRDRHRGRPWRQLDQARAEATHFSIRPVHLSGSPRRGRRPTTPITPW